MSIVKGTKGPDVEAKSYLKQSAVIDRKQGEIITLFFQNIYHQGFLVVFSYRIGYCLSDLEEETFRTILAK